MQPMEWWIETTRMWIVKAHSEDYNKFQELPLDSRADFGELLCWEIYTNGMSFVHLAEKWNLSLDCLGELMADHCRRLAV